MSESVYFRTQKYYLPTYINDIYIYIYITTYTTNWRIAKWSRREGCVWVILMFLIYLSSYPQMTRINQLLNRTLTYIFREEESVAVVLRSGDDNEADDRFR